VSRKNGPFSSRLTVPCGSSSRARVTSDGGLILVRELDERLELGELIERHLTDARGKNTQLPLADRSGVSLAHASRGSGIDAIRRVSGFARAKAERPADRRLPLQQKEAEAYIRSQPIPTCAGDSLENQRRM
jgi:hypothetical protein